MYAQSNVTGTVQEYSRRRGPVWYARIRTPNGQKKRLLGPAWHKRGRPPEGYYTEATAKQTLSRMLIEEETTPRRGRITFADAANEWLRYSESDRECRPSTLRDYQGTVRRLIAVFGSKRLESIDAQDIETYKATLLGKLGPRSINRHLVILGGIFRRAERKWGHSHNPVQQVQRQRESYGGTISFLTPPEVQTLVRATLNEQDAALYLTAALTGLRQGELLALTWTDVDFGLQRVHVRRSYCQQSKQVLKPKSGKVRSVPMVDEVMVALDKLSTRERFTDPDDLVFPDWTGAHEYHSHVRERFHAALRLAGLQRIRFHDLRHTFGTLAVQKLPMRTVQEYMGHAAISTTMIYSHYAPAGDEAAKLGQAFNAAIPEAVPSV